MRTLTLIIALLLAVPALADLGTSGGHDLDDLWAKAQADYDLGRQDAVILLRDTDVVVNAEGDIATRVHTLVWIGSSQGIRHYADLRVPWNSATSTLDVEILRTWRGDRWWPDAERISDTAVVHTLPHALRTAYDYGAMRETMLLHDGVELPCIVETAYTITEVGRPIADGIFVFSQEDPAVAVEFTVTIPAGIGLVHDERNGAPAPVTDADAWTWNASGVAPLTWPATDHTIRHEPVLVWSVGSGDADLASPWNRAFEAAVSQYDPAALEPELSATLATAPGGLAGVRAVAAFLAEAVRPVPYEDGFWRFQPRDAGRVWATAYGHALDRAVLTTAVLRSLGYTVSPLFAPVLVASSRHAVQAGDLVLRVGYDGLSGRGTVHLDPTRRALHDGSGLAHAVVAARPESRTTGPQDQTDRLEITISLSADEDGNWAGAGRIDAAGTLALGDVRYGEPGATTERLAHMVDSVIPTAIVSDVSIHTAASGRFESEFTVKLPAAEDDSHTFVLGSPAGGYPLLLGRSVDLADAFRGTPVAVDRPCRQRVTVRFDLDGWSATHVPSERVSEADVGEFRLGGEIEGDWLTFRRELELEGPQAAGNWPGLRRLLLEETDPANGTVVLKRENDGETP